MLLGVPIGARQEERGFGTRRSHHNPALWPPVVGQRRGVILEIESEGPNEEFDSSVVVIDDNRHQIQERH
jgi:hypothetical protein